MTSLQEFAFFFVLGLVGLAALIVVVVAVAAVHFWQQDMRHLRRRAREAAPRLEVVQPQAHVYVLAEYRGGKGTAA